MGKDNLFNQIQWWPEDAPAPLNTVEIANNLGVKFDASLISTTGFSNGRNVL